MTLAYEDLKKADLPIGPFPSPYGSEPEGNLFESLVNSQLHGEVYTSGVVRLPKGAMLELRLLDISLGDCRSVTLSKRTILKAKRLPMRFGIPYDREEIRRAHTYSISGTIHADGRLLYANRTAHLVFTDSNFSFVRLCLTPVD
ncbi:Type III secretion system lipoprotein chaperone (YscW) [Cohaesibacter sp. ES.047]|uniref:YbaY family lipoprotein n=1 Tax=Cohaesibacter sp. ES.047 TaxID=1798205 RepID=UPI000BB8BAB9|nr:YbaY family lipoprotein [Cohaesibacter sp. ES.047]SNY91067.1 Type III secretion system lipoprotein chaperone (YscW) [Cohaesibacter sp. ES.047]